MMMPCFITGAYAFSTTRVSEFVCALRRMRVPESVAIPCMVVIRFFPTIGPADSRCCGIRPSRWSSCWFRC